MAGVECMGGGVFLISGRRIERRKKYKIKYGEGLRWLNGGTQQKVGVNGGGGAFERRRDRGGRCVGGLSICSGRQIERQKIENKRGGAQALGGPPIN